MRVMKFNQNHVMNRNRLDKNVSDTCKVAASLLTGCRVGYIIISLLCMVMVASYCCLKVAVAPHTAWSSGHSEANDIDTNKDGKE